MNESQKLNNKLFEKTLNPFGSNDLEFKEVRLTMKKFAALILLFVFFVLTNVFLYTQESWVEEVKVKAFDLVEKEEFEEAARNIVELVQ